MPFALSIGMTQRRFFTRSLIRVGALLVSILLTFGGHFSSAVEAAKSTKCVSIPANKFNFKTLEQLILSSKSTIHSVEDLICVLPDNYKQNYSLVFESRSLQHGSPDAPRAILFDPNSKEKIFITFNGKKDTIGFNNVEIMREVKGKDTFVEFVDVDFNKTKTVPNSEIVREGPFARISTNPKSCLSCHGNAAKPNFPARPLFDAIPFWPNVYDSALREAELIKDQEVANFQKFKQAAQTNSRYSLLKDLDKKEITNKFEFANAFDNPDRLAISNAKLTASLAEINRKRLAYLTRTSKDYSSYKFAIVGGLLECQNFMEFFPENVLSLHTNRDYLRKELQKVQFTREDLSEYVDILRIQKTTLGQRTKEDLMEVFSDLVGTPSLLKLFESDNFLRTKEWGVPPGIDKLRFIMEGRRNSVDLRYWGMDAEKSNYRYTNGPNFNQKSFIDEPESIYWAEELIKSDKELIPLYTTDANATCDQLKNKSLARLNQDYTILEQDTPHAITPETGRVILQQKCASCHGTGALNAPALAFHDVDSMRNALADPSNYKYRKVPVVINNPKGNPFMPKFDSLLEYEKKAIRLYIDSLRETPL